MYVKELYIVISQGKHIKLYSEQTKHLLYALYMLSKCGSEIVRKVYAIKVSHFISS